MSLIQDEAGQWHDDSGEITEEEFVRRFTAHCLKVCGFTTFDDGATVKEYCDDVARSYFADPSYREEGPEACADADMSYWGEE